MPGQTLQLERRTFLRRVGLGAAATLAAAVGLGRPQSRASSAEAAEAVHDLSLRDVVTGAIGPSVRYCMGYSNPGATGLGYIATLKLSADVVNTRETGRRLDEATAEIVSYDMCERKDAYIGQINMIQGSSFCGLNGAVWGYHLAIADQIKNGSLKSLYLQQRQDGRRIPVYPVAPLLDTTERLFGTVKQRRFPLMPGAHVVCAYKYESRNGPCCVWAAIALAIAEDRSSAASLFIEDHGWFDDFDVHDKTTVEAHLQQRLKSVTTSAIMCGEDQNVLYREIFAGYKYAFVKEDERGTALACAPYIILARNAVPSAGPTSMINMTISQWEQAIALPLLAS